MTLENLSITAATHSSISSHTRLLLSWHTQHLAQIKA